MDVVDTEDVGDPDQNAATKAAAFLRQSADCKSNKSVISTKVVSSNSLILMFNN